MKTVCLLFPMLLVLLSTKAQTTEDSVRIAVSSLFSAMRNSDAKALTECFAEGAILQTISRNGTVRNENVAAFATQIGKLPKDSADERIVFETIKIDDGLAAVWTPYQFYYAGTFSHCGVNSFQLVRQNGRWKIQYLIDTRRRVGCQ